MDLRILFVAILNFETMIYSFTSTIRICYFGYCNRNRLTTHCNADIVCEKGTTIHIIKVKYSAHSNCRKIYINDCNLACYGNVVYNLTYTNEIGALCNGQEKCPIRKGQTDVFWELEITFDCKAETVPKTLPTFPSSTGTITCKSETKTDSETTSTSSNDALTTPTTTPGNDSSNTADFKTDNSSSSEKFPVPTFVLSLAAGLVVLVIIVISMVCIKRRKANKENAGREIIALAVTYSVDNKTNTADRSTEAREHSEQDYEYAAALIAINKTNENEYNTLNETAKPIKADPNYDHIPKQSTSVNETSTITNEDIYNTLNENAICNSLNNDPYYDHVSKQWPSEDQTYSHIKGGQFVHNQSNYQVYGTDTYSHWKQ